jgi:hypothetical protein
VDGGATEGADEGEEAAAGALGCTEALTDGPDGGVDACADAGPLIGARLPGLGPS